MLLRAQALLSAPLATQLIKQADNATAISLTNLAIETRSSSCSDAAAAPPDESIGTVAPFELFQQCHFAPFSDAVWEGAAGRDVIVLRSAGGYTRGRVSRVEGQSIQLLLSDTSKKVFSRSRPNKAKVGLQPVVLSLSDSDEEATEHSPVIIHDSAVAGSEAEDTTARLRRQAVATLQEKKRPIDSTAQKPDESRQATHPRKRQKAADENSPVVLIDDDELPDADDGGWSCASCTFANVSSAVVCAVCDTCSLGHWRCCECSSVSTVAAVECSACQTSRVKRPVQQQHVQHVQQKQPFRHIIYVDLDNWCSSRATACVLMAWCCCQGRFLQKTNPAASSSCASAWLLRRKDQLETAEERAELRAVESRWGLGAASCLRQS